MSGTLAGLVIAASWASATGADLPGRFYEYLEEVGHGQRVAGTWPDLPNAFAYLSDVRVDWGLARK